MCFSGNVVGGLRRFNWDGDCVVFDTTVPSQRPVVGGKRNYQIDVREFVLTTNNAVIRHTLKDAIRPFAKALVRSGDDKFEAREKGCFDFRTRVIQRWVGDNLKYRGKSGRDPWQFPDETLTLRAGDCEDLAFLMASLLLASGISGYHVRVALGEVRVGDERFDHAWVMYKNEAGHWEILEPLRSLSEPAKPRRSAQRKKVAKPPRFLQGAVRYVPSFLFNDEHLWIVERQGNPGSVSRVANRSWRRMSPKFAGDVHLSILDRALTDVAPPDFMNRLHDRFQHLALLGPLIDPEDWVDVLNPSSTPYDPRQHFDNGLISESWDLLENNAATFRGDRSNATAFAKAAHAVADFYAHSSYLAFAWTTIGPDAAAKHLFHPDTWNDDQHLHDPADYGPAELAELGRFDLHRFSKNQRLFKGSVDDAIALWNDRIVSGRYAQDANDRHGSVTSKLAEAYCLLPAKYQRAELGALPHHAEIAVDDADWSSAHLLFERDAYPMQYRYRVNTAIAHVRELYQTGVP
jgi:Transglutaminase-like superfamily